MLIDQLARPTIPPPPPGLSDSEFEQRADSIKKAVATDEWSNQRFVLGINNLMEPINQDIEGLLGQKNQDLVKKLQSLKTIGEIELSKIEKVRNIEYRNLEKNNHGKRVWDDMDMAISFSRIAYSPDYSEAVMIVSASKGKMNGYSDLLLIRRIEGAWKIINRATLLIS